MALTHRAKTRALLLLGALLLAAAALEAALLWRDTLHNKRLAAGMLPGDLSVAPGTAPAASAASLIPNTTPNTTPDNADAAVPEFQFALAHAQAASGATEAALNSYQPLQAHARLGAAARYNSANLLLRQAIALQAGPQPAQALPLIELAKEQYRALLRDNPQLWDAKYNLERAQRLLPDPQDAEFEPTAAPRSRERSATSTRALSLGLP